MKVVGIEEHGISPNAFTARSPCRQLRTTGLGDKTMCVAAAESSASLRRTSATVADASSSHGMAIVVSPSRSATGASSKPTSFIGDFYTSTLNSRRARDRVHVVYSRSAERGAAMAERHAVPHHTTNLKAAIEHPDALRDVFIDAPASAYAFTRGSSNELPAR